MPVRRVNPEIQGPTSFIVFSTSGLVFVADTSEALFEWADIKLLRPCRPMLDMQMPVSLSDGPDFEHAAPSELLNDARKQGPHLLSIDRAVNDDVCNMNALLAEL